MSNTVKEKLLQDGAKRWEIEYNWTILNERRKMAIWMQGYLQDVKDRLPDKAVKRRIIAKEKDWERIKEHHKNKVKEIIDDIDCQIMMMYPKCEYYHWIKSKDHCRSYVWILSKIYETGFDNMSDYFWRELAFRMTYHSDGN